MRFWMYLIVVLCSPFLSTGQSTADTLSYDQFIDYVLQHHPVVRQIQLFDRKSQAYNLKARSIWDPKISGNLDRKTFDEKSYFNKLNIGGEMPSAFAAKGIVSYESNDGIFLNPEATLPAQGLVSAGINLPLIRGLLFDERRRIIQEAQLLNQQNELKQIELGNKLLASATKAYVDWQLRTSLVKVNQNALGLAVQREDAAKSIFTTGDGPAIDTLEARIDVVQRKVKLDESIMEQQRAKLAMSLFLWDSNDELLTLRNAVVPQELVTQQLKEAYDVLKLNLENQLSDLPSILMVENEIGQIDLERKILREQAKPQLDLKWLPLQWDPGGNGNAFTLRENNKFNLGFQANILNRKAKADLQLNRIEREMQSENLRQVRLRINTNLERIDTEIKFYQENLSLIRENVLSSSQLLEAERVKFSIGESSIFLLNSRELKLLDAQIKSVEFTAKMIKARIEYLYEGRELY